jgi:hypothetical protein
VISVIQIFVYSIFYFHMSTIQGLFYKRQNGTATFVRRTPVLIDERFESVAKCLPLNCTLLKIDIEHENVLLPLSPFFKEINLPEKSTCRKMTSNRNFVDWTDPVALLVFANTHYVV